MGRVPLMRKSNFLAVTIIVFAFFAGLIAYYFIFTNKGSTLIVKSALLKYTRAQSVNIQKSEGILARTLVFHDVEIVGSNILRLNSIVKIQRLEGFFEFLNLEGINVKIYNGRLLLPNLELIVFRGNFKRSIIDANIYSKGFNVERISGFFPEIKYLKGIAGSISNIDIYTKGTVLGLKFNGECQIEKLLRKDFSLSNCPVLFNLQLKNFNKEPELNGTVFLNSGTISGLKTALINLSESKISFSDDSKKASLDLKGTADVEGTKINIVLKGTFEKPELKLTSEPPLPQERLLVMLITGKSWNAAEMALDKGQFSLDLVKDFVDYFLFSGSGSKIFKQLGISDISVTLEQAKKGVVIKKAITEKIEASYAVEQSQVKEALPTTTQKVGGEYKITEGLSIEAEKELKQEDKSGVSPEEQKPDDKVMIKFKKKF